MKIAIESTGTMMEIDGVTCSVWRGITEDGTPVQALMHGLAAPMDAPPAVRAEIDRIWPPAESRAYAANPGSDGVRLAVGPEVTLQRVVNASRN